MGIPLLILPSSIAIGDIIAYENVQAKTYAGRKERYTFAGAGYFKRMQEKGLYTLDIKKIRNRKQDNKTMLIERRKKNKNINL